MSSHFRQRNWVQPERLRSGFLQADLSLIVQNDPPARVSAQAPRFFVIYDSQFALASSRFGRDSIQYRVGKTQCQGHQDPSKSVSIVLIETEANSKMVFIYAVFISLSRTVWSIRLSGTLLIPRSEGRCMNSCIRSSLPPPPVSQVRLPSEQNGIGRPIIISCLCDDWANGSASSCRNRPAFGWRGLQLHSF